MDDSDDYVFDDIILDEQTLATLDQQERQFLGESSHASSTSASEPVNKRFKTNNGWTPGPANIDYDEMPEICLQRDGTYGVGNPVNALTVSMSKLAEQKSERSVSSYNYPVTFGHLETDSLRGVTPLQNMLSGPSTSRLPLHANSRQKHTLNSSNSKTTSFRRTEPTVNNVGASTTKPRQLPDQMLELQKKLDELREENSKIQTALQDAIDVKLAKEGEVSTLRKNIEKTSQNHAAQIAQLKAEKEKADLKQTQMQKEMKDEMERLRTQFVFKQQELESSIRKPMGSVRGKKAFRELPSTPLPIPYAMRSWNFSDAANSRRTMEDTPLRPSQLPPILKITPSEYPRKSPEKQKKLSMLPGFQNAFEASTPMRSPSKPLNKGKGKMEYDPLVADTPFYNTSRDLSQQSLNFLQSPQEGFNGFQESVAKPLPPSPLMLERGQTKDKDMDTAAITNDESEEAPIPLSSIEDVNWKLELSRIILTYSHPTCGSIIFQQLLGLAGSVGSRTEYTASCGKILEVVASSSSKVDDYEESLHAICRSLLSILVAINETQQLNSLAMLLDLLRELVLSLPKIRVILVCSPIADHNEGGDTFLLDILSKIILEHVQPTKTHIYRDSLAKESLSLLESLCFSALPEAIEKLGSILRNREVLMVLMHTSQPAWLLDQSSRLLVLLSTHHTLFRAFLNIPNTDMMQNTEMTRDPLIERLCSHLIETGSIEPEAYKLHILTCFAQLSIAHSDAHAALTASYVIPSLVLFVTHLATPIWEDDGKLSSSPSITSSIIQTLNQTILLLYSLIFRTEPALNLRHILQHAPHRPFNSISNIFVVTFGRLSYCDSPGWIEAERRQELEILSEMAREILEVVVDGPEGDNVWAAFQTEPEEDGALDDEEIEARRMGVEA